jgi:hypothetical protein
MEKLVVAHTDAQWQRLLADPKEEVVRSKKDWHAACADLANHPLPGVDEATVKVFTAGLSFERGGLAHADYSMLLDKLTIGQFHRLWAFFGISPLLLNDHDNKECSSRATCSTNYACICTSNCFAGGDVNYAEFVRSEVGARV